MPLPEPPIWGGLQQNRLLKDLAPRIKIQRRSTSLLITNLQNQRQYWLKTSPVRYRKPLLTHSLKRTRFRLMDPIPVRENRLHRPGDMMWEILILPVSQQLLPVSNTLYQILTPLLLFHRMSPCLVQTPHPKS